MKPKRLGEISGIVGMASAVLYIIGLIIEYLFGLQPPGDGSFIYKADQFLFFLTMIGYLITMVAFWQSRVTGEGIFGKISLGIFIVSLAATILANIGKALTNNSNFFLFPIAGLLFPLGGLLTGIAVVTAKRWDGWQRYAPLLQGVYYIIWLVILIVTNHQSFIGEALGQCTWFLTSLALFTKSKSLAAFEPASA